MSFNYREAKHLLEAAKKDGTPERFYEHVQDGLEKGHLKPDDFSVRKLFESLVPDGRELVDLFAPRSNSGFNIREANSFVDTSAFSNITGQIVYNAMLEKFRMEELVFSRLIQNVPTQFNGEKIAGIGGLGDMAETIAEGAPYPTAGLSEDYIETPQTTKRGFIVPITKEAIFFDRTGNILTEARRIGEYLAINKEKRLVNAVIDENSTLHRVKWKGTSYASYQASTPWVNLVASNALADWTDIDAAEQALASITDPTTGEPILITPKHLLVTRDLLYTARRIVNATNLTTVAGGYATSGTPSEVTWQNPVSGYTIVSSQYLKLQMATDTSWYIGDMTKAVKYMENWPLSVVQAANNSEAEFTQDVVVRFKASERGAAAVVEPRAMVKCTA